MFKINTKSLALVGVVALGAILLAKSLPKEVTLSPNETAQVEDTEQEGGLINMDHPLSIDYARTLDYPGSEIITEQTLSPGSNYQRHVVSYKSEGLKQYALLTVPNGEPPEGGWPAIVFNHGYISPSVYRTTERYIAYTDGFSRNGYVLIRPDYRGHANSEGEARGGYSNNDYTADVLNALSSLEKLDYVSAEKIGMWGHSMGGHITLRAMAINPSIKVGVIWAGVVGSYEDLVNGWRRGQTARPSPTPNPNETPNPRRRWRTSLTEQYGTPQENPDFWDSISATSYLTEFGGPIQLHHATGDTSVNYELSENLHSKMQDLGLESEVFIYQGDDHNLTQNFGTAMSRSISFFDSALK